MVKKKLEPLV